jgi:hypothetical protein
VRIGITSSCVNGYIYYTSFTQNFLQAQTHPIKRLVSKPFILSFSGKHLPDVPFERRTYDSALGDNGGDEFIGGHVKGRIKHIYIRGRRRSAETIGDLARFPEFNGNFFARLYAQVER